MSRAQNQTISNRTCFGSQSRPMSIRFRTNSLKINAISLRRNNINNPNIPTSSLTIKYLKKTRFPIKTITPLRPMMTIPLISPQSQIFIPFLRIMTTRRPQQAKTNLLYSTSKPNKNKSSQSNLPSAKRFPLRITRRFLNTAKVLTSINTRRRKISLNCNVVKQRLQTILANSSLWISLISQKRRRSNLSLKLSYLLLKSTENRLFARKVLRISCICRKFLPSTV